MTESSSSLVCPEKKVWYFMNSTSIKLQKRFEKKKYLKKHEKYLLVESTVYPTQPTPHYSGSLLLVLIAQVFHA